MKTVEDCSLRSDDLAILINLADALRRWQCRRGAEFVRPMDVGRNVSAALARLARSGLAQARLRDMRRNWVAPGFRSSRQSLEYKITDDGLAVVETRPLVGAGPVCEGAGGKIPSRNLAPTRSRRAMTPRAQMRNVVSDFIGRQS